MSLRIASLVSGSSGNATYVQADDTSVLVDCGASARAIVDRMVALNISPAALDGILITHAHADHYRAAGTLNARYGIPVYADPSTVAVLRRRGRHTSWKRLREVRPLPEEIGALGVEAYDTSHGFDTEDSRTVCFVFRAGKKGFGVVTDLGSADKTLAGALSGLDGILLEANYDAATVARKLSDPAFASDWNYLTWVQGDRGHLSNRQCAELLASILDGRTKHVLLGHMSNNHRDLSKNNNSVEQARAEVERVLAAERIPMPALHATYRIGLEPGAPGPVLEL